MRSARSETTWMASPPEPAAPAVAAHAHPTASIPRASPPSMRLGMCLHSSTIAMQDRSAEPLSVRRSALPTAHEAGAGLGGELSPAWRNGSTLGEVHEFLAWPRDHSLERRDLLAPRAGNHHPWLRAGRPPPGGGSRVSV